MHLIQCLKGLLHAPGNCGIANMRYLLAAQVAAYCEERGLAMPDLTALPAVPGGKPKQAPPRLQTVPAPASVQPAGPAPDQAPLASSAATGEPASAPARDTSSAAASVEGEGRSRPEPGLGMGSAMAAAGRGADGGPAPNGGGLHAGVPAPHAGSHVRAGQQVCGLPTACMGQTSHVLCKQHELKACTSPAIIWLMCSMTLPESTLCARCLMRKIAPWSGMEFAGCSTPS